MEELLRADELRDCRYRAALRRFLEVTAHRRRHFEQRRLTRNGSEDQGAGEEDKEGDVEMSRMFVLSETEEPWKVFPAMQRSTTVGRRRLRIQRFVYEWSDVHFSALHSACASGDKRLVHQMLLLGRDPQRPRRYYPCTFARDSCGRIPLHHAAIREQHKVVRLLLHRSDAKLQVRILDNAGLSSAHYVLLKLAALAHRRSPGASISSVSMRETSRRFNRLWRTADLLVSIMLAPEASSRQVSSMQNLSAATCDANDLSMSESVRMLDKHCRGDEWDAVRSGDLKRLEFLFQVHYVTGVSTLARHQLPVLSNLQRSLLHEACDSEQVSIVCFLVTQCRAPRLLQDTSGCTALHYAAMRGCLGACVVLLEDDSDESGDDAETLCLCVDKRGRTALHWSILSGAKSRSTAVAKYLATKCIAALQIYDDDGFAPLHYAVWRGDLELVQVFVEFGADVNARVTPLTESGWRYASRSGISTAPWAPCGARFHSVAKKTTMTPSAQESITDGAENDIHQTDHLGRSSSSGDASTTPASTLPALAMGVQSLVRFPESVSSDVGAIDTLRYWLHGKPSKISETPGSPLVEQTKMSKHSAILFRSDQNRLTHDNKQMDTSEAENEVIGCIKYGGVCPKCIDFAHKNSGDAVATTSSTAVCTSRKSALSPLVVAVQACARRTESIASNRWKIVAYLLASGADPNNHSDEGEEVANNECRRSPLCAALTVVLESPQILSLILEYGARSVNIRLLERFCCKFWSWSSDSPAIHAAVERALTDVLKIIPLDLSIEEQPVSLMTTMFVAKCFGVLTRLLSQNGDAIVWESVCYGMSRRSIDAVALRRHLGCEHLQFVSEYLEEQIQKNFVHQHQGIRAIGILLRQCVGWCLGRWRRESNLVAASNDHEHCERQQAILSCLCLLVIKIAHSSFGAPLVDPATLEEWTDHCIALGFFECALMLVDMHLGTEHKCSVSLDRILGVFDRGVVSNRHNVGQLPAHHEFLSTVVQKISSRITIQTTELKRSSAVADTVETNASAVFASLESVIHVCANNLPIELLKRILDLARTNASPIPTRASRVRGKTLAEWITVYHQCKEFVHLLLERNAVSLKSDEPHVVLWQDLVCAFAVINEHELLDKQVSRTQVLNWLVSLYPDLRHRTKKGTGGDGNRSDGGDDEVLQLKWFLLERALRCDSVLLFTAVIEPIWELHQGRAPEALQEPSKADVLQVQENASQHSFLTLLLQTDFFFQAARWNALQVTTYVMQLFFTDQIWSKNVVPWRNVLVDGASSTSDAISSLRLCYELGHLELAELFLKVIAKGDLNRSSYARAEVNAADSDTPGIETHGLLHTILRLNAREQEINITIDQVSPPCNAKAWSSLRCLGLCTERTIISWQAASAFNLATHLEALRLNRVPIMSRSAESDNDRITIPALVQLTIECGSLDALRWWLDFAINNSVAMSELNQAQAKLFDAASKHPSDIYATMTLLLLDAIPYAGRIAGDGTDTTLLHRCVCFSNRELMEKVLSKVFEIPGSNINVLDGFGNSPVVYAFLSGNLPSVLALVSRQKFACRLEAEYEGQSCFYYTLHLAPSFGWRWMLQKLLVEKCERRFLHCGGEDDGSVSSCGCKGFEQQSVEHRQDGSCSFCGHRAVQHSIVPFPPWFMDQYETYLEAKAPSPSLDVDAAGSDSGEQELDRENQERKQQLEELMLENERGRLDCAALSAIAAHKYADLAKDFGLATLDAQDPQLVRLQPSASIKTDASPINSEDHISAGRDMQSWTMLPLVCLASDAEDDKLIRDTESTTEDSMASEDDNDGASTQQEVLLNTGVLPWYLQNELNAAHAPSCRCQNHSDLVTDVMMWKYQLVSRWLWVSASLCTINSSTPSLQSATPMCALKSSKWAMRLAFCRWRKDTMRRRDADVLKNSRLHTLSNDSVDHTRSVCKLQQFLSHWQFANAFAAFHRWKHDRESASVQHQRLETALDDIVAHMRRTRFATLRAKQLALQQELMDAGFQTAIKS